MADVKKLFIFDEEHTYLETSYDEIVENFGHEVIAEDTIGSYSGDHFYLLKNKETGEFAFLEVGYGSCSGCDMLESAYVYGDREETLKNIQEISDMLEDGIIWMSKEEMLTKLQTRDPANSFWYYEEEGKQLVEKFVAALS